jgi:hypothetical protein
MKKTVRAIRLQRETVQQLSGRQLEPVRGGWRENTNYVNCSQIATCVCP